MIDVDPATLGLEFGGCAILAGVLGFATKQVSKHLTIVFGVQLMAFQYLESQEIVRVDWSRLSAGHLETGERVREEIYWLESMLSMLTVGTGFISGFLIGYHRG